MSHETFRETVLRFKCDCNNIGAIAKPQFFLKTEHIAFGFEPPLETFDG